MHKKQQSKVDYKNYIYYFNIEKVIEKRMYKRLSTFTGHQQSDILV